MKEEKISFYLEQRKVMEKISSDTTEKIDRMIFNNYFSLMETKVGTINLLTYKGKGRPRKSDYVEHPFDASQPPI